MILQTKELEIAAVGISVAAGCIPCTRYHLRAAKNAKASDAEISKGFDVGTTVARLAIEEIEERLNGGFVAGTDRTDIVRGDRTAILAGIGATVARNSVSIFVQMIDAAAENGVGDDEIMEIVGLARRIMAKAASHLDPSIDRLDADPDIAVTAASLCT